MKEQRIAACIITGDNFNEDEIKELLASVQDHVHGIFVAFNGKDGTKKGSLGWQNFSPKVPVYQQNFDWEDDFSKARQQSFDMVPKDEYDWFLWLDTDDRFVVDKPLQDMFESLDPYTLGIFLRYDYAIEPVSGEVVVEQWRERFLSTKTPWKWHFLVHEVAKGTVGTVQFAKRDHCRIEHLRKSGEDRGARIRNRRILEKARKLYPDEPRYVFYHASELLAEASEMPKGEQRLLVIKDSLNSFIKFKEISPDVNDDYYLAQNRIAELFYLAENYISSLDAHLECIAIYPEWPDAYVGAAKCCMELSNWGRMKSFANMATKCPKPLTAAGIESMLTTFYPYFLRGIAEMELGETQDAIRDLRRAKKVWNPPGGEIDKKIKELQRRKKEIKKQDERLVLRGTKPEKSIAFFTNPLPFVWHPEVQSGAGAELCVMEIAKRFVADGWRTVVFGTPGEYRGVDKQGIEWWNSEEYNPMEPFTVLISSRSALPFINQINSAASYLWMHDVNIGPQLSDIKDKPTRIVGLTNWHIQHMMKLYDLSGSQMALIPNGINIDRFPVERLEDDGAMKFIWSSSADRGLEHLLGLWPIVREKYPNAELQVFYGWDIVDSVIEENKRRGFDRSWLEDFREKIFNHIEYLGGESAGIYNNGRVDQETLAKAMYEANYWPYTTAFCETFCITLLECLAAGVIPIASNLAAVGEHLSNYKNTVTGWPANRDYQVRWLSKLDDAVNDKEYRREFRKEGRQKALEFTWDNSYSKWNNLFKNSGLRI